MPRIVVTGAPGTGKTSVCEGRISEGRSSEPVRAARGAVNVDGARRRSASGRTLQ